MSITTTTTTTTTTYKEVQLAFRKLALRYHPDTAASQKQQQQQQAEHGDDENNEHFKLVSFTEIREAFEAITEGPNGEAILRDDDDYTLFYNEARFRTTDKNKNEMQINTNNNTSPHDNNDLLHPSINPQILREVAQVADTMNPGGLDKGGMWQYANMINRMAKEDGGRGLPPLRVDGGDGTSSGSSSGVNARRRRRK